ncbi:MAG: hypothetical protein M3401_16585 [Actinomycetota bacterium]|nr:hypothetical protein [Actinomycetota bacterium]
MARALAVLDRPKVHSGHVEFGVVALREVGDERDDRLVAVVEDVLHGHRERPVRSLAELLKEAHDLVVAGVVARDRVSSGDLET